MIVMSLGISSGLWRFSPCSPGDLVTADENKVTVRLFMRTAILSVDGLNMIVGKIFFKKKWFAILYCKAKRGAKFSNGERENMCEETIHENYPMNKFK